tara:strand:+ start:245 stop:1108 length:864 start_codon:yes stop_codon:yes gene_type:complete
MESLNILITGRNGFLGKELESKLKDRYNVLDINRFNVTDPALVEKTLLENDIDVVIHTAAKGGKRTQQDSIQDLVDNLLMFKNLVSNLSKYKVLFTFCSGAAFNKREEISNVSEDEISLKHPYDYYGLSKNLIAREVIKYDNVFNFRLFGCFGKGETPERFFTSLALNSSSDFPHIIHENIYMDFFSTTDVAKVVMYYIENYNQKKLPQDINLVYPEKYNLYDLAGIFFNIPGTRATPVIVNKPSGASYTGDGNRLQDLGIELEGLTAGLADVYKYKKNRKYEKFRN